MDHIECSPIKFKTSMLRSSLCGYSDTYILVKGTKQFQTQEQQQPLIIETKN